MDNFIPLESIRVATPCRADWNRMEGDQTVRFCQSCRKSVYNLSAMSRENAQTFVNQNQDACVRFFRREDGTLLLGDCPVGKTVLRRPFWKFVAGFAALLMSGAAVFGSVDVFDESSGTVTTMWRRTLNKWRKAPMLSALTNRFQTTAKPEAKPIEFMGATVHPSMMNIELAPPQVQR